MREKVWFPDLEAAVDEMVRQYPSCQLTSSQETPPPIITEELCQKPWSKLNLDFGSFPGGRTTAVIVDSHSKYPIVEVTVSTAFSNVAPVLENTFALFGIPDEIKTDNGPPFQGAEFKELLTQLGIKHCRITPQ